jgi:hypothetical protein
MSLRRAQGGFRGRRHGGVAGAGTVLGKIVVVAMEVLEWIGRRQQLWRGVVELFSSLGRRGLVGLPHAIPIAIITLRRGPARVRGACVVPTFVVVVVVAAHARCDGQTLFIAAARAVCVTTMSAAVAAATTGLVRAARAFGRRRRRFVDMGRMWWR